MPNGHAFEGPRFIADDVCTEIGPFRITPYLADHRYQTVQAADWITALAGRLGAFWKEPEEWPENAVFGRYFEEPLAAVQVRSGIRD